MELKLNHLQHIGIPVNNLLRSAVFYKSLGFENAMTSTFMHNGEGGKVMMMRHGNILIEIYEMPERELVEIRNRQDGHIDHIAFDVDDIESAFQQLKKASFSVVEEAPVFLPFWNNGCRYFNIVGPDGERLEFNQIL